MATEFRVLRGGRLKRARSRAAVGLTLMLLVGLAGVAQSASASPFYGVSGSAMLATPGSAGPILTLTRADGMSLARFSVAADADEQIGALAAAGIEPYPILDGDYGTFAARFGVGGSSWTATSDPVHIYEVGNEPNIAQTPVQYAATFRLARSEILAQDPGAVVVVGGLAALYPIYHFDVYDWTSQMLAALGSCPDAIGYHAYASSLADLQAGLGDLRTVLDRAGCPATGIELNEFYMTGGSPSVLTGALAWLARSRVGLTRVIMSFWYGVPQPSLGFYPAMDIDGMLTPLGRAWLAFTVAPAGGAPPVTPPDGSPLFPPSGAISPIQSSGRSRSRCSTRHHRRPHCHRRRGRSCARLSRPRHQRCRRNNPAPSCTHRGPRSRRLARARQVRHCLQHRESVATLFTLARVAADTPQAFRHAG